MNRSGHPCTWTYSGDDYSTWDTTCGRAFCMTEDTPKKNDYNFCPGCGGELIEVIPVDPPDDECEECGGLSGTHTQACSTESEDSKP